MSPGLCYKPAMADSRYLPPLLIVNPASGKGRGGCLFGELRPALEKRFPGLQVRISEYAGHAVEIARDALQQGFRRLLTIGGDGTPFEVLNGAWADLPAGDAGSAADLEIGMIPAGTGNSFIRDFAAIDPAAAVERIAAGPGERVDVVEFSYNRQGRERRQYFLNILGIGLIADILKLTNERFKRLGALGYSAAVMVRLARRMRNAITLDIDGRRETVRDSALVVCNSKYTGGKMKIAPQAETGDGSVDLVVFNEVSRRDILAIFSRVFSGRHVDHPKVLCRRARELVIEASPPQLLMADGELLGETPARLRVWPRALTVRL